MMTIINQKWRMVIYADLLFLLLSLLKPSTLPIMIVLVLWADGMIYAAEDLEKRGVLFVFLITFFLMLIGREALERFGIRPVEIEFPEAFHIKAELMAALSLICLYAGFFISDKMTFSYRKKEDIDYDSYRYVTFRNVSRTLFLFTFVFMVFTAWDIVSFVLKYGYLHFYSSYQSSVPYVFRKIGEMCPVCFWVFLAAMPDKRDTYRISALYFLYLILTLATGQRFPFAAGLLILFAYFLMRNRVANRGEVFVSKKMMTGLVIAAPLLVIALFVIGQVRLNRDLNSSGPLDIIINFIYKQGVSINVIKRADFYAGRLPAGKLYLFGSTYENIINNIIFRKLGFPQYSGNNAFHAMQGYSFQHALSYALMGDYYVEGHGFGSCFIAEAFHDLGWIGVITVSMLYGVIFRKMYDFENKGILWCTLMIGMLKGFLLAPRGSADGCLADMADMTIIGILVIIWIVSSILSSKRIHRRRKASDSQ